MLPTISKYSEHRKLWKQPRVQEFLSMSLAFSIKSWKIVIYVLIHKISSIVEIMQIYMYVYTCNFKVIPSVFIMDLSNFQCLFKIQEL